MMIIIIVMIRFFVSLFSVSITAKGKTESWYGADTEEITLPLG